MAKVEDGIVATHPIAGTRPRGKTSEEDAALEQELKTSEKQRAEHIMLVDLGRNDIGRVSIPGTVEVTQLMDVERFSHVMHLVSHVEGRLKPELSSYDALRSCFPAGTVSGAPKIRAMEIISELEEEKRGPYGGAVGLLQFFRQHGYRSSAADRHLQGRDNVCPGRRRRGGGQRGGGTNIWRPFTSPAQCCGLLTLPRGAGRRNNAPALPKGTCEQVPSPLMGDRLGWG